MRLKSILQILFIWQAVIVLVTFAGVKILPIRGTYLGGGSKIFSTFPILYSRANFDGNHYIAISRNGYGYSQQAFFPFYPNLIRTIRNRINPDHYWQIQVSAVVGTIISLISFAVAAVFFVKLVEIDYSKQVSKLALIILLVYPMSFYLTSVYTEGLFFLLLISSFYFARTKRWWLACALAGLATYTRFIGLFIAPALLAEVFLQNKQVKIKHLLPLVVTPMGLAAYMYFLWRTTGDPLAFMHSLPAFGPFRSNHVIMLYQVFWRYAKMVVTVNRSDPLYLTILLEAATGIMFLITSIWSFIKQRLSYALFNVFAFLVPTFTGSFVSLPRYALVCFPTFILLAQFLSDKKKYKFLYLVVSVAIGIVFLAMFSAGYWVA